MLIKQGKTNVKHLFIVVVLAAIVGGGTLWLGMTEQKIKLAKTEELEKTIPTAKLNLKTTKLATVPKEYQFVYNPHCPEEQLEEIGDCSPCENCFGNVLFGPYGRHIVYLKREKGSQESVVFDNKEGVPSVKISNITLSPDGEHFAYVEEEPGIPTRVVVDGNRGEVYYTFGTTPVFSPDSQQLAYCSRQGKEWFIVIVRDGKENKIPAIREGCYKITFSPDSKHLAYKAKALTAGYQDNAFVVWDGKKGQMYDRIRWEKVWGGKEVGVMFSPDSQHIGYYAQKDGEWILVIDDEEIIDADVGKIYSSDWWAFLRKKLGYPPTTEPIEKHTIKTLSANNKSFVVINGEMGKPYDRILTLPEISSDNKYVYYGALIDNELWWVVEDLEIPKKAGDETTNWQTYRNEEYGFEVKYPEIDQKYINILARRWPPKIIIEQIDPSFSCQSNSLSPIGDSREIRFNDHNYCIISDGDAAAGTRRTHYDYITNRNNKQITLSFATFLVNCNLYEREDVKKECEEGWKYFEPVNFIKTIDAILSTFRFLEEAEIDRIACEEAGGTYVGCPASPGPNMGLCIPCECPQGYRWYLPEHTCVGICPGENCDLDKEISY